MVEPGLMISNAEEIDATWLNAVLRASGRVHGEVSAVRVEPFPEGFGFLGKLFRVHLTAFDGADLPKTLVVKIASPDEATVSLCQQLGYYEREVVFYRNAALDQLVRVPRSYFGQISADGSAFTIVMEDLQHLTRADQVAGATPEQARAAIALMAKLHAHYWNRVDEPAHAWMKTWDTAANREMLAAMMQASVAPLLHGFGDFMDPRGRRVTETLADYIPAFWAHMGQGPQTFVHSDYRLDNLLFDDQGDITLIDWQLSGRTRGPYDLGYFVSQSLPLQRRREMQDELVERYHDGLVAGGVDDYTLEMCREDFRRSVLYCFLYPAVICSQLDTSDPRSRQVAETLLERSLCAISDLEADGFLEDLDRNHAAAE